MCEDERFVSGRNEYVIDDLLLDSWTYKYFRIYLLRDEIEDFFSGESKSEDAFAVMHLPTGRRLPYGGEAIFEDLQEFLKKKALCFS